MAACYYRCCSRLPHCRGKAMARGILRMGSQGEITSCVSLAGGHHLASVRSSLLR